MAILVERAKVLIIEFWNTYPVARKIDYKVRETQEELYGQEFSKEKYGKILGGFQSGTIDDGGQFHRGLATFATANFCHESDFAGTLRHEVLGHFGINTFTTEEKRELLNAIIDARNEPNMEQIWSQVDKLYSNTSETESRKAEEVYAFVCEAILPEHSLNKAAGEQSIQAVFTDRSRSLQFHDLQNITRMVAAGMRDNSRLQQNFPTCQNEQFKMNAAVEALYQQSMTLLFTSPQEPAEPLQKNVLNEKCFELER